MGQFSVYTSESTPRRLYSSASTTNRVPGLEPTAKREPPGEDDDIPIQQLCRERSLPVDLFVAPTEGRVVWSFRAVNPRSTSSRLVTYVCEYRSTESRPGSQLFTGLAGHLEQIQKDGWSLMVDPDSTPTFEDHRKGWSFHRDPARWQAGLSLPDLDVDPLSIDYPREDDLVHALNDADDQLALGMASYTSALRLLKQLTDRPGCDVTLAINTNGPNRAVEGVDLVLWPGADEEFAPMNERTRSALGEYDFWEGEPPGIVEMAPAEEDPSDDRTRALLSGGVVRVGIGLSVLVGVATLWSFTGEFVHPLSGLAAVGGTAGAALGIALPPILERLAEPDTERKDANAERKDADTERKGADADRKDADTENADPAASDGDDSASPEIDPGRAAPGAVNRGSESPVKTRGEREDGGPPSGHTEGPDHRADRADPASNGELSDDIGRENGGAASGDADPADNGAASGDARESERRLARRIGATVDLDWGWSRWSAVAGYSLLAGFLFPTLFRLADWWPVGEAPIRPLPAVVQASVYVAGLLGITVVGTTLAGPLSLDDLDARTVARVGSVLLLFGAGIIVGDGLACMAWYDLLGFDGAC